MAIVKMKKLSFSVHNSLREGLMTNLQKAGCFHLENVKQDEEEVFLCANVDIDTKETDYLLGELEDSIEFLEEYLPVEKVGMIEALGQAPPQSTLANMKEKFDTFEFERTLRDIRSIEKKFKDTKNKLDALLKEKGDLIDWQGVGIDLDILNGKSQYLAGLTGYVPSADFVDFVADMQKATPYVDVLEAFTTSTTTYVYIIFHKEAQDAVMDAIKELGFAPVHISQRTGELNAVLEDIDDGIVKYASRLEIERIFILDYTHYLPTLKSIYDYLLINQQKMIAEAQGVSTETVSFYMGWVPKDNVDDVESIFDKHKEIDYALEDPTEEEFSRVPIALKASKASKPFELLTRMYGLPVYGRSLDPTAHLSPFYFIFYGFCLSDFFYGLIMFLLFGFLAKKAKNNPETSNFMMMLSLAGISAMVFGVLFGSFFGDLFVNPDYFYIPFIANLGVIDTLKNPMLVLYIALILGAIHLLYGLLLNLITKWKDSVIDAIFDNVSWMIFLVGFFGWAILVWLADLAKIPTLGPLGVQITTYLILGGAGLIVINGIRKAKSTVGGKILGIFGGIYDLYGATGYISDLLSYARLLALGLSTGVIAGVFNYLAFMVLGEGSVGGYIGMGALLIFGHVFNLVLSAFGAFVHSLRLQFVEFFSKFIEAGGKDYEPLREEGLYHRVKRDEVA